MMVRDRALWLLFLVVVCLTWAGAWAQEERDQDLASFASLLQRNEAVLTYEVEAEGVYLRVITSAWIGQRLFVTYPREQLLSDVIALRAALEPQLQEGRVLLGDPEPILAALYAKLVQPCLDALARQGLLEAITTLVIIPSGPLWYVPFSALLMVDWPPITVGHVFTREPYLVEHYSLAFVPSLREVPHLEGTYTDGLRSTAVINCPWCPEQVLGRWVHSATLLAAGQLPGGEPVQIYEGGQATTEALVLAWAEARYLILLVPTRAEAGDPWLSSLVFVDAPYELWKVAATSAHGLELVVIPTHHDAVSDLLYRRREPLMQSPFILAAAEVSAESVMSLDGLDVSTWYEAFRAAGAQGVLLTRWCANEQAFQDLFQGLCSYRAAGLSWAEALAQAQRHLLREDPFTDFWFWAPFILMGNWR